ncbi:hypothetical protein BJP37_12425 [Moorena bouillonii PNG]|uniref:Uncharacterized protein n=1 Tax=Moorena bouillonii PNG TaxID=568701 RepID=A0A1U7N1A4_9CYAN|nr:hypothetical protein BJP37_12425 [Moorena bouillonii PNG]
MILRILKGGFEGKLGVAELKYQCRIFWFWASPLNPPTLGDFKSFVPPKIGGLGRVFLPRRSPIIPLKKGGL